MERFEYAPSTECGTGVFANKRLSRFFIGDYSFEWLIFALVKIEKMKKLLYFLLLGSMLSACSNDFEVAAPWKSVPVAYGILSPKDTAQYVRVEKAFLDPNQSALVIAQIADSLYYAEDAITVWLERPSTNARVQMLRVDGNLEGYVREEGIFANQPNWLYKASGGFLTSGETYKLIIEHMDGTPDVTAQTTVPDDFLITIPDPTSFVRKISFSYSTTTTINWRTDENGVYFNVSLVLPFREEAPDGTPILRDTLIWKAASNVERFETQVGPGLYKGATELPGAQLFRFLSENLQPTNNFRYFERGSIILEGGGKEIREFNITAAANSGLTGAEVFPVFTNLSEGFGIFTAKNEFRMNNIQITPMTIDSMKIHPLTQGLKFSY